MATIDAQLAAGLTRMGSALDRLLAIETRQLDTLTPAEIRLESQFGEALTPVLDDLYWYPLRNGISEAPTDERRLRRWLREQLSTAAAIAALLALLRRYLLRGANVGGQMGLDLLGLTGDFLLVNPDYIAKLDARADDLTTYGSGLSLIDTTVDDLARGIPQAREDDDNTLTVLAALIAGWVLTRSNRIAVNESSWSVTRALNWLYAENGVNTMVFRTREDDRVCPVCESRNGTIIPVDNVPPDLVIPIHVGCRCVYIARTQGWVRPSTIWRGG